VSADVGRVLALPDAKQRLAEQGAEPAPNAPEAFTALVNEDVAKWLELAGKAGIRLSP
jgi:tripartite-type tricarboxylate transporter receptor subunit TctC